MANYLIVLGACFTTGVFWAGVVTETLRVFEILRPGVGG
jgi:hypothetical protein